MATAHGVTSDNVLDELAGVDVRNIKAGLATNITLTKISEWITEGANIMQGVFDSIGASVSGDVALTTFARGVLAFAKSRCYERLNHLEQYRAAAAEFASAKADARKTPVETGGVQSGIVTNVNTSDPYKKTFAESRNGDGFKGW